jgi:hypothetical protein
MTLFLSSNGWLLWYGGLLFAGVVFPAKLMARQIGLRIMDEPLPVVILKKMIRTLFRYRR